jgi:hypothetical protein
MPTEQNMELEARLIAIESLLTHIGAAALVGVPETEVQQAHDRIRNYLKSVTFLAQGDPVMKDHFAALIEENVDALLTEIEDKVKQFNTAIRRP